MPHDTPVVEPSVHYGAGFLYFYAPWHFLYFFPLPHGQGSFRPILIPSSFLGFLALESAIILFFAPCKVILSLAIMDGANCKPALILKNE